MDPTSTVRTDALPAIATLVIPGAFAGIPYAWMTIEAIPALGAYLSAHDGLTALIAILGAVAIGFMVESLGSFIEVYLIDKRRKDHSQLLETWWRYLRIAWEKEPIGQRYLRRLLVTFKFELNMSMAMLLGALGFAILPASGALSCKVAVLISLSSLVAAAAFFFLARISSSVLAQIRQLLVTGVGEPPFDKSGNPKVRPLA